MPASIPLSVLASFYCFSAVIVREDENIPENLLGMVTRRTFVPAYVITLRDATDRKTFWHEVWHVRVMNYARLDKHKGAVAGLRKSCRNLAETDIGLRGLLHGFYDSTPTIDASDEPVIWIMERPILQSHLSPSHRKYMRRLQRPACLDWGRFWMHYAILAGVVLQAG